jgi:hypothetical protein
MVERRITAIVVVLTPPAVDPGFPPINIRTIVRIPPGSERVVISIPENPAVRGVTV